MNILIKVLKPLKDKKAGDVIEVDDTSTEWYYWERRLEDAKTDNCCEVFKRKKESEISQDVVQSESEQKISDKKSKVKSKGE